MKSQRKTANWSEECNQRTISAKVAQGKNKYIEILVILLKERKMLSRLLPL